MSLYTEYLEDIETRKGQALHPKPIEDAALVEALIAQILDVDHVHRADSLHFLIYNTLPGTTSAASAKAQFLKEIIEGSHQVDEITPAFAFELLAHMKVDLPSKCSWILRWVPVKYAQKRLKSLRRRSFSMPIRTGWRRPRGWSGHRDGHPTQLCARRLLHPTAGCGRHHSGGHRDAIGDVSTDLLRQAVTRIPDPIGSCTDNACSNTIKRLKRFCST